MLKILLVLISEVAFGQLSLQWFFYPFSDENHRTLNIDNHAKVFEERLGISSKAKFIKETFDHDVKDIEETKESFDEDNKDIKVTLGSLEKIDKIIEVTKESIDEDDKDVEVTSETLDDDDKDVEDSVSRSERGRSLNERASEPQLPPFRFRPFESLARNINFRSPSNVFCKKL